MSDHERVTAFFASAEQPQESGLVRANLGRLVRRYAAEGTATGYRGRPRAARGRSRRPERSALLDDLDRGLAERAVGLPPVGQGGLFDALAAPGAEPAEAAGSSTRSPRNWPHSSEPRGSRRRRTTSRTRLALRADVTAARDRVHADLADPKTPRPLLLERLAMLEELGDARVRRGRAAAPRSTETPRFRSVPSPCSAGSAGRASATRS